LFPLREATSFGMAADKILLWQSLPTKYTVCYSFTEMLEEGPIGEMKVGTQRMVSPKK
jgi:hypothetical protein